MTKMTDGECELMWKLDKIHITILIGVFVFLAIGCTYIYRDFYKKGCCTSTTETNNKEHSLGSGVPRRGAI